MRCVRRTSACSAAACVRRSPAAAVAPRHPSSLFANAAQLRPISSFMEEYNEIVAERLAANDVVEHGFLLDGYPRTPDQATALEGLLAEVGTPLDAAVNLDVPVDEVTARMVARGRTDDTEEAIRRRLDLYELETEPLPAWFAERGLLDVVDGLADEETVFGRLMSVIDSRLSVGDAG